MMNQYLITVLKANMGQILDSTIAADIMHAADYLGTLVHQREIDKILPEQSGEFLFSIERMEHIIEEMKPLHRAHWAETETHRHGLELKPDYDTFIRYERAGRYILFTLRHKDGKLVGNCAMYLARSTHTDTLMATEDTLYLVPAARHGKTAAQFIEYCENALRQLGVREINVTVKTVNKAERFFKMLGYKHVQNGLTKVLTG